MSRDEIFYTGVTSSVPRQSRKETVNKQKLEQKAAITPAAKVVFDLIETEKANILDLRTLILDPSTQEIDVKSGLMARKLYYEHLTSLQNKLTMILKARPLKTGKTES